jgi:hypothetical protein
MARRPTFKYKPAFKPSLAETKRANQTALDFMRVASYREDAPRIDVGATAKREPSVRAAPSGILERDVLRAGLQLLRVHPLVAWASRINSGAVENANGQFVRFNQIVGCSDIVGQMKTGHFLALEAKRPGQKPTEPQMLFLHMVEAHGGCSGWFDSVDALESILARWATR